MAKTTIEWCDHSINPLRARDRETGSSGHFCLKLSPGCAKCYSSRLQSRFKMHEFTATNRDKVELFLHEPALEEVLRRKKPTRYFWCDMTDMFLDDYAFEWIDRIFAVMALTPQHTHMVLTKRPERMRQFITDPNTEARIHAEWALTEAATRKTLTEKSFPDWPLKNCWLGVSCENQKFADERIPLLLQTPAAKRFVSYEPALAAVNFNQLIASKSKHGPAEVWDSLAGARHTAGEKSGYTYKDIPALNWVIVGGESGPGARPFDIQWARAVVRQCKAAGAACFVKQLGGSPVDMELCLNGTHDINLRDRKGGDMSEWPEDLRVREFPQ